MKLRPLNEQVVLSRMESKKETAGGLIIPEGAQELDIRCVVMAIGPKVFEVPKDLDPQPQYKVGDVVLLNHAGSGRDITINGEEALIVHADDIIAVIE